MAKSSHFFLLSAAVALVASLTAALWYARLSATAEVVVSDREGGGGGAIRNYFLNVWFCLLLAFLLFENILLQSQDPEGEAHGRAHVVLGNAYYVATAVLCLEMAASWDVYGRADVAVWCSLGVAASIVNIYSLSSRNIGKKKQLRYIIEPTSTSEKTALIDLPLTKATKLGRADYEDLRTREDKNKGCKGGFMQICTTFSCFAKTFVLVVTCFLLAGGIIHGMGTQSFPPGHGGTLLLSSGVRVYYQCGPDDATDDDAAFRDTVLLHGNTDQGIGDFLGVTDILGREYGVRFCSWDRPGVGFSDYARPKNVQDPAGDLADFVRGLSEAEGNFAAPYFVVGYEKGGVDALKLASSDPDMVSGILLVDTVKPAFKRRALKRVSNATADEADRQVDSLYRTELAALDVVNRLAVPLGMTKVLTPSKNTTSWDAASAREQRWYDVTEKAWLARWSQAVRNLEAPSTNGFSPDVPADVRVDVLMSSWSEEQAERLICGRGMSEADCRMFVDVARLARTEKASLASEGGSVTECTRDECHGEYFLYSGPAYTAGHIRQMLDSQK